MSLVSTGLSLIHTTTVERDQAAEAAWGDKSSPDWQTHIAALPCRFYANAGREQTDPQTLVVVEDMRLIVMLGTDITEQDRLGDITYRGTTIVAGPISIRAVIANHDHLEIVLERIS